MSRGTSRPIFILGCERSGTTLLRAMLTAHSRIAVPFEAFRFSRMVTASSPWTRAWMAHEIVHPAREFLAHPKMPRWGLTIEMVLRELPPAATYRYADLIRAVYAAHARKEGKMRWGDKTPMNAFDAPHLLSAFPEAQFLHLIRDGRDVCLSWAKVDWAHYTVPSAAKQWAKWVRAAAEPGRAVEAGRYLELRYEDLVRQPSEILQQICRFLEEPFEPQMLAYYTVDKPLVEEDRQQFHRLLSHAPDASRAYAWQREMPSADIQTFERLAGSTLMRYGYPVAASTRMGVYAKAMTGAAKRRVKALLEAVSQIR